VRGVVAAEKAHAEGRTRAAAADGGASRSDDDAAANSAHTGRVDVMKARGW